MNHIFLADILDNKNHFIKTYSEAFHFIQKITVSGVCVDEPAGDVMVLCVVASVPPFSIFARQRAGWSYSNVNGAPYITHKNDEVNYTSGL